MPARRPSASSAPPTCPNRHTLIVSTVAQHPLGRGARQGGLPPAEREARTLVGRGEVGCHAAMDASITLVRVARVLTYLVYAFVLITLVILVLGFFLLLFGANPDAPFSEWAYRS